MADIKESKGFQWTVLSLTGFCVAALIALQISTPTNTTSKAPKSVAVVPSAPITQVAARVEPTQKKENTVLRQGMSVNDLTLAFEKLGYRLDDVSEGDATVPRLFLTSLPHDLDRVKQTELRKAVFFKSLLPLVLKINEEILADRARVLRLRHRLDIGLDIAAENHVWLNAVFDHYGVKSRKFDILLRKMDVVPPSLALAQAAEESGWGTSRFVREGNALFGQWTFNPDHKGIVPAGRAEDQTHRIRAFDSIKDSLKSYVHNLNTHAAYRELRVKRNEMRTTRRPIEGYTLATTLLKYSERGEQYVASLQGIMETNNLRLYDGVTLADEMMFASADPAI